LRFLVGFLIVSFLCWLVATLKPEPIVDGLSWLLILAPAGIALAILGVEENRRTRGGKMSGGEGAGAASRGLRPTPRVAGTFDRMRRPLDPSREKGVPGSTRTGRGGTCSTSETAATPGVLGRRPRATY